MSKYQYIYDSPKWKAFKKQMAYRSDSERPYLELNLEEKNLNNYLVEKVSSEFYQKWEDLFVFKGFAGVLSKAMYIVHKDGYTLGQLREMAKNGPRGFKGIHGIGPMRATLLHELFKKG